MTPDQIDRAHLELDQALRRLSDPEDIERRRTDRAYSRESYLHIQNLALFLRESMPMPVALAGYAFPTWCVETTEAN
jgi:hypothetical protein